MTKREHMIQKITCWGKKYKEEGIDRDNAKDDQSFNPPVNVGHQQFFSFLLPLQHLPGKPVKITDPVRCTTDVLDHSKAPLCGNGTYIHKISSDFRHLSRPDQIASVQLRHVSPGDRYNRKNHYPYFASSPSASLLRIWYSTIGSISR